MAFHEERRKVLQMIEEGKITPEEGARLLAALGTQDEEAMADVEAPDSGGRQLRVRVTHIATGQEKAVITLPLGVIEFGLQFLPANDKFDPETIQEAIRNRFTGRLVDVLDEDRGERVEILIE